MGGGLYVQHATSDEPHQCDAREPQFTLRITDVNFVNNTASIAGGNIFIMDDSSVCNDINISSSSIIGGKAQWAGGVHVRMSLKASHDRMKRKWNDSEYCNTPTTGTSEKRLVIWNGDIQSNFATDSGRGLVMEISGLKYLAPQSSFSIDITVTNTTLHGNKAALGIGGNMLIMLVGIPYDSKEACNLISFSI